MLKEKSDILRRDILRDFCLACRTLEEQFARFAESGSLSFAILSGLIGDRMSKGPLWRLKDTSHHLFGRLDNFAPPLQALTVDNTQGIFSEVQVGGLLDWTIGYVFHECIKITEDAYQLQYYSPRLKGILELFPGSPPEVLKMLMPITQQSYTSLAREATRVALLLDEARRLFCLYLAGQHNNLPLARFLYDRDHLVRGTFHAYYEKLLASVYGEQRQMLYLQAARSLIEVGHGTEARQAVQKALLIDPESEEGLALLKNLK